MPIQLRNAAGLAVIIMGGLLSLLATVFSMVQLFLTSDANSMYWGVLTGNVGLWSGLAITTIKDLMAPAPDPAAPVALAAAPGDV
jgi:hypothetical protein